MTTNAVEQPTQDQFTDSDLYDNHVDLREYARILRKHRWFIVITTALLTGLAAFMASNKTPVFRATSTLLIESQQASPMNLDNIIGIDTKNKEYYQSQLETLKSRKLARRVVTEMDLYSHPELSKGDDEITANVASSLESNHNAKNANGDLGANLIAQQRVVNRFMKRTRVTPVKGTKMVRIGFDSQDPVFATRIANKIGNTYIQSYLDSRSEIGERATLQLNEKLARLRVKLEQSQLRLINYKEDNGLIDIQGDNNRLSEQEIGIITNKLLDAESKTAYAKIVHDEVRRTESQGVEALMRLPAIGSNEMIRSHTIDLQETQFHLDELANRYGEKHPKVLDALSRQATARSNLINQINHTVDFIEKEYLLSKQTMESLRNTLNSGKDQLQQSNRSRIELEHLEREVQITQELYDNLYLRSREVDEADTINTRNAQIIEFAEVPLVPTSPKKTLITLLAFILSAAASLLIAILRESANQTITSSEDVEFDLGAKMLGILPLIKKPKWKKEADTALVPGAMNIDDRGFEESIRTIRTSICLEDLQRNNKVIMVTSALPGEGKSTLASHLAYSLSNVEKVLLIECDLRRPSLHQVFDLNDTLGLVQLMDGTAKFAQCIKQKATDNLDVIPAGAIPERPLDLLTSKRFERLISHMRSRYDRVIIDSAPVQAVSDALLLGQLSDTALYTVKSNSTKIEVAARGVNRIRSAGINIAGVIVSQVNLKKLTSSGEEMSYQGYYDHYGYADSTGYSKPNTSRERKISSDKVNKAA